MERRKHPSQDIKLDQVYMTDKKILEQIITFSDIKKDETILEIGAGPGNLTKLLTQMAKKVISIEIDMRLKESLLDTFKGVKNVEFIWENALEVLGNKDIKFDKMICNPPYSISEPMIKQLFKKKFKAAIITLPWRFVERLAANPEEANYSKLSLFFQVFFRMEILLRVPEDAWSPVPDTDGVIIRLTPKVIENAHDVVIKEVILQDDKKLKNSLMEAIVRAESETKRKAKNTIDDIGLSKSILEKKISEMSLKEIINAFVKMKSL